MNLNLSSFACIVLALSISSCHCSRSSDSGSGREPTGVESGEPTLSFVAPAKEAVFSNESAEVEVAFTAVTEDATWSLFYTQVKGAIAEGTVIVEGEPVLTSKYTWVTKDLEAGTYYLYAVLNQGDKAYFFAAAGSFAVSHPEPGNNSPTVSLTFPKKESVLLAGTSTNILYTVTDPDSGDDKKIKLKFELSSDSGSTWELLKEDHQENSYSWEPPASTAQGLKYRMRITADDGKGGLANAMTDDFGIAEESLNYASSVKDVLELSCSGSSCHSSGGARASDFVWEEYSTTSKKGVFDVKERILARITNDTMPPASSSLPKLSSEQKISYELWLWSGASEGTIAPEASASFKSPVSGSETADSAYTVEVAFSNVDDSATWALYYTLTEGAVTGGTLIQENISAATKTVQWNTSALSPASYYLYLTFTNLTKETKIASTVAVVVSHPAATNNAPTVSLSSHNGSQTFLNSSSSTITWTASDPDSDDLTFDLEYSTNSGSTWTSIATDQTGVSYVWDMSSLTQGVQYRVRITADDDNSHTATDSSDANFGVTTVALTYDANIRSILGNHCGGPTCHGAGQGQSGAFQWDVYSGSAGALSKKDQIIAQISNDTMPPGSSNNVSSSDKELIQMWVWDSAPEN